MTWSRRALRHAGLTFAQDAASQREYEAQRKPWPHDERCDCLRCENAAIDRKERQP